MTAAYWRTERISNRWLGRFQIMDPAEHFTLDEWQRLVEDAFEGFKGSFEPGCVEFSLRRSIAGVEVDFSNHWRQWLAINYEERFLFLSLASRWLGSRSGNGPTSERYYLAGTLFDRCAQVYDLILPFPALAKPIRIFFWLDQVWLLAVALAQGMRQIILLLRHSPRFKPLTCRYLWTGISAAEIPERGQKLNFAFLAERDLIDASECLYLLPDRPSQQAQKRLQDLNIRWALVASHEFLRYPVRTRAAFSIIRIMFRELAKWRDGLKRTCAMQVCFQGSPWLYIGKELRPEAYLTSVSACWPEPPEVAVMNALGVRTINWSYGANSFCYSESDPDFQDLALARSMPVAKEVWVWNEEVRELLEARALCHEQSIHLTGPVMCGDSRWLNTTPADVRAACGIRTQRDTRFISVFDVPPVSRHIRLQIGHGPSMYPPEMLENFYNDIRALVEHFPGVTLIMKPKRALDDPGRDYPEGMNVLLDPQGPYISQGRLVLLEHDIDPYIPVAMADICLGVPFTSPVMVGINAGRAGIYYDPLGKVNFYRPKSFAHLVTHSRKELLERLQVLFGNGKEMAPCKLEDPTEQFARMLQDDRRSRGR